MAQIRSRILQYMPKELLISLNDICYDVTIPDNNTKVNMMVSVLDKYDIDYIELGPGTNRYAILIDGYVFKIAMDRYGIKDNWAEFAIAKELQPYVTKTYECNGLVVVAEYVTVISKDEFIEKKDNIRNILSYLAQGYLMGDVGSISKNFMNWGYRDDGQLVILDYAYIYRIKGDEMICGGLNSDGEQCMEFLEYDENFNKLTCPKCRKTYTFYDIRKKIDSEYEKKEVELSKEMAYQTTEANTPIGEKVVIKSEPITKADIYGKDEEAMYKDYENEYETKISNEDFEKMYDDIIDKLPTMSVCNTEDIEEPVKVSEGLKIDMEDVLETAEEFVEQMDIKSSEDTSKCKPTSEYEMMKESIVGGATDDEDEYYSDPEEIGYISEEDEDKPSTISETITSAIHEELNEEFDEIEDKMSSLVINDDCDDEEVISSIEFIDEEDCEDDSIAPLELEDINEEDTSEDGGETICEHCECDGDCECDGVCEHCSDEEEAIIEDDADENDEEDYEDSDADCEEDVEIEQAVHTTIEANPVDEIPEEDLVERDLTESEQNSFIQFIDADEKDDDIEAMRNSLKLDIPSDDELDDIYDDCVRENQSYRYNNKRGRVE